MQEQATGTASDWFKAVSEPNLEHRIVSHTRARISGPELVSDRQSPVHGFGYGGVPYVIEPAVNRMIWDVD